MLEEDDPDDWYDESHMPLAASHETPTGMLTNAVHNPPVTEHSALKWHKLDVPIKEQQENARKSALEARIDVTPQPALSCDVHRYRSSAKSYQDFSLMMNKIVGAKLNQM